MANVAGVTVEVGLSGGEATVTVRPAPAGGFSAEEWARVCAIAEVAANRPLARAPSQPKAAGGAIVFVCDVGSDTLIPRD